MHLEQIPGRIEKLRHSGIECRIASGAAADVVQATEQRLGVTLPEQVFRFYSAFDGLTVAEPNFTVYALRDLEREGSLLHFCQCDHLHRLAFETASINTAEQWFIVNAETGYRITYTMASFWSVRMWSWIELQRPIWYDFHSETTAG